MTKTKHFNRRWTLEKLSEKVKDNNPHLEVKVLCDSLNKTQYRALNSNLFIFP